MASKSSLRVAYITPHCPHYRVTTFETLARYHDVDYYFFSAGDEWYWQRQNGVRSGDFKHEYLPGIRVAGVRLTPTLPLKLLRHPYAVYVKCVNGRFTLPVTYLLARLKRKPFVLWTGIWMRLQSPGHRLGLPLTRYIYRHADAIAVYGEHVKRYLIEEGVPEERIFVAAHAVDNEHYRYAVPESQLAALREQLTLAPTQKVVLYLGRVVEEKGIDHLIRAFAAVDDPDTALVIAGSGSATPALQALTRELGLESRVRFPGYVPTDETVPYYALASICVLPSITTPLFKEPWGLVVNEAFNQGTPVIATDAVGAAAGGLLQDGVNGLVVPERNDDALAAALCRLLREDDLREAMGARAREMVAEWNNERMVQGIRDAIDYATKRQVR